MHSISEYANIIVILTADASAQWGSVAAWEELYWYFKAGAKVWLPSPIQDLTIFIGCITNLQFSNAKPNHCGFSDWGCFKTIKMWQFLLYVIADLTQIIQIIFFFPVSKIVHSKTASS